MPFHYVSAEPFEPQYRYRENPKRSVDKRGDARIELLNIAFRGAADVRAAEQKLPVAKSLMPPVRNYFDAERRSFGKFTGSKPGATAV